MPSPNPNVRTSDVVGIIARSPRRTQMVKQELLDKLIAETARLAAEQAEKPAIDQPVSSESNKAAVPEINELVSQPEKATKCPVTKAVSAFKQLLSFFKRKSA